LKLVKNFFKEISLGNRSVHRNDRSTILAVIRKFLYVKTGKKLADMNTPFFNK